jgi:NhaP-type Na+/H+ or K+/H+ antiporter
MTLELSDKTRVLQAALQLPTFTIEQLAQLSGVKGTIVAATIALSIVVHSTTDVPAAKMLRVEPPNDLPNAAPDEQPAEVSGDRAPT